MLKRSIAVACIFISFLCVKRSAAQSPAPQNYMYTGSGELAGLGDKLDRPDIMGAQVVYTWKSLEPEKGKYDFSAIERDLQILRPVHKQLFIQIQDRFFSPQDRNLPNYLLRDPIYTGGIVRQADNPGQNKPVAYGWVAEQWNPAVRHRYQELLRALAKTFDGRVTGVNLPESAIDIDMKHDKTGFTCDGYFNAELENMKVARDVFKKSYVVQYINFWPCGWGNDHNYMRRSFEFASQNGIGVGGPDIVPYQKGQMNNSYPFFHEYRNKLVLIAMAVQEPTLTYINPATHKPFTKDEFQQFGRDYLGTKIIFWSASSPWLNAR
jgi:hypothetical protein